ncbi:MAG TPA: hypothetical protein PL110_10445 [Candidatus Eremiobacteraeota bacterium]|nr:MAG: hypothetical protein BWY64_00643 [bacterium ADurb.Bin363]HPZ08523.1 hypothetical protein [Candidatus Eremiobacteraeota bacterium]
MSEKKPLSDYSRQREHFLSQEMIKMDRYKPEKTSEPKNLSFIRLTLDDDIYVPPESPSKKHQHFLKIARNQVLKMDNRRKDFLKKAAKEMVKDVLGQEFGKSFMNDKGFLHMQETITNKILNNPNYKELLQKLLGLMGDSE